MQSMTIQIQFVIANRAHHIIPYKQGGLRKYIEKYGIDGNLASIFLNH